MRHFQIDVGNNYVANIMNDGLMYVTIWCSMVLLGEVIAILHACMHACSITIAIASCGK